MQVAQKAVTVMLSICEGSARLQFPFLGEYILWTGLLIFQKN